MVFAFVVWPFKITLTLGNWFGLMCLSEMFNLRNAICVSHKRHDGVNTHNAKQTNPLSQWQVIGHVVYV